MLQHIGVHIAEGGPGPVRVAVGEGLQNPALEIGAGVHRGDGGELIGREVVTTDAQHIGLDTGCHQSDFGIQEFRHPGSGV